MNLRILVECAAFDLRPGRIATARPEYRPDITGGAQTWNLYIARQYRPRKEILDGAWKFPEAQQE